MRMMVGLFICSRPMLASWAYYGLVRQPNEGAQQVACEPNCRRFTDTLPKRSGWWRQAGRAKSRKNQSRWSVTKQESGGQKTKRASGQARKDKDIQTGEARKVPRAKDQRDKRCERGEQKF